MRKNLLRQKANELRPSIFDGTMIFSLRRLSPDPNTPLQFTIPSDEGTQYNVSIRFVAEVQRNDMQFIHILNIILNNCVDGLKLVKLGRSFFDPKVTHHYA